MIDIFMDRKRYIERKNFTNKTNKKQKQVYALVKEDDFGGKKIKYFYCNKTTIERIAFKEYLKLKRKRYLGKEIKQFYDNKRVIDRRNKSVLMDKGFKIYEKVYYIPIISPYTLQTFGLEIGYDEYFINLDIKTIKKKIKEYLKIKQSKDDVLIKKRHKNKIVYTLYYEYKCSYEYDEYDEAVLNILIEKLDLRKIKKERK